MKLNKQLLIALAIMPVALVAESHSDDSSSKTFFSVNNQYSTGSPEHLSLYRFDRMREKEDGCRASFQVVGFGGQSTNKHGLARYFFPYQKSCLVIAESPDPNPMEGVFIGGSPSFQNNTYDLLARNFNIETTDHNFESKISIRPEQTYGGAALNYSQYISRWHDQGLWFDITLPVVHVKNKVNLDERVTSSSTPLAGSSANMRAAFMNPAWRYGKIAPCGRGKTGVADIEVRIGLDMVHKCVCNYGGFIGFIAPTGNHPSARYLFEPMVGRNHHWGIIWGSESTFELWESEDAESRLRMSIDLNNNYLFEATERRSFDLRDKSWSRYINLFADSRATTTIPGINVLTQKMKIKPHGIYQVNSAFVFDWGEHLQFEAGAHLFFRQAEEGRLCGPWIVGPGIAGTKPATATPATSMSNATMHMWDYELIGDDADMHSGNLHVDVAANIPVFRPIRECDLNLQSALHPFCGGWSLYGTTGYQNLESNYPWLAAIGGGYQWADDNALMHRWSLWGKLSVSI